MNLEYRINESYDRLTANDREVLNRILRNKAQSAGMNSTELAAFCHVSRTTLIRLFKKLGIGGFAEFRLLLKERAGMQELARLDMEEIISNYHRIGEEFKRIFLMFGKCCIDLFDYGEVEYASRYFKSGDLFVAISLSGESENGIQVLRFVQCREIKTLSITRWTNNTMARMCRYNLYAGTRMISGGGEPGYEMVATFYILLDMLSVNYLEYERKGHETGRSVQ